MHMLFFVPPRTGSWGLKRRIEMILPGILFSVDLTFSDSGMFLIPALVWPRQFINANTENTNTENANTD
jgi:hypothetical protein